MERKVETAGVNDIYVYNQVLLDSHDAESGDSDRPIFNLHPAFSDCVGFKIISARVPFSYYVFNQYNNTFTLNITYYNLIKIEQTITVPIGNYTIAEFVAWFDDYLPALDSIEKRIVIDSTTDYIAWNELQFETPAVPEIELNTRLTHGSYTFPQLISEVQTKMRSESLTNGLGWDYQLDLVDLGGTNNIHLTFYVSTYGNTGDYFRWKYPQSHAFFGDPLINETLFGFGVDQTCIPRIGPTLPMGAIAEYPITSIYQTSSNWYDNLKVSYSDITGKITVTNTDVVTMVGDCFNFTFNNGESTPQYWLGAAPSNTSNISINVREDWTPIDLILEFPYTIQITGPNYLLLNSNVGNRINQNIRVNGMTTWHPPVIAKIPVDANKWEVIQYDCPDTEYYFDFGDDTCQTLEFWFTWGDLKMPTQLDFNKQGFSLTLGLLTQKTTKVIGSTDLNNTSKRIRVY